MTRVLIVLGLSTALCASLGTAGFLAGQTIRERLVWADLAADAESYARQARALQSAWQKEFEERP